MLLRRSCFFSDADKLVYFKINEIESMLDELLQECKTPFVFCITESYKKHNSFKARLNYDKKTFYIQSEDREFLFPYEATKELHKILKKLYKYFTKAEIISGYYIKAKGEIDINNLKLWEAELKKHRGKLYFNFLVNILQKEAKNDDKQ